MLQGVQRVSVCWARQEMSDLHKRVLKTIYPDERAIHWSRAFEYPWVFMQGFLQGGMQGKEVLDAAGGDGPLQFLVAKTGCKLINLDIDPKRQPPPYEGVVLMQGDIREMPFLAETFDLVMCISVLEHVVGPLTALPELWRVLKPGGKLLLTFDVATYARWNHTIDMQIAEQLVEEFGYPRVLLKEPPDISVAQFNEIERQPGDPETVELKVLCLEALKAE